MSIEMNIAAMSTQMKSAELSQDVGVALAKKVMNFEEVAADNMLQMLEQVQSIGHQINTLA